MSKETRTKWLFVVVVSIAGVSASFTLPRFVVGKGSQVGQASSIVITTSESLSSTTEQRLSSSQNLSYTQNPSYISAANGEAFALHEIAGGIEISKIKTTLRVFKAFGLGQDHQSLLYTSLKSGIPSGELYVENLVTGQLRRVSDHLVLEAAWSPVKANEIAYTFSDGEQFGLAMSDVSSGYTVALVSGGVLPDILQWSDSGDGVYYFGVVDTIQRIEVSARFVAVGSKVTTQVATSDVPRGFPVLKSEITPQAEAMDQTLHNFSISSDEGSYEVFGDDLLSDGELYVRSPSGEVNPIGKGQLLRVLKSGLVMRVFSVNSTQLQFRTWNGQATDLALAAVVNFNLPLSGFVLTQGGSSYPPPGNCQTSSHTGSLSYAYDMQNSSTGAHILASADGLVVSTVSSVTCNSCDTNGCSDYSSTCSSNGGWGNTVIIQHSDGTYSRYAHMQPNSVQVSGSSNACQGLYIGRQGHTGCTRGNMNGCGDHVHFQRQSTASGSSISVSFSDVNSNPLSCGTSYTSGSTEISSCCGGGTSESFRINGGPPVHPNGTLTLDRNDSTGTVYLLQNGQKRGITSEAVLHNLYQQSNGNFDFKDVITVASDELGVYPTGTPVSSALPGNGRSQPDGRLISNSLGEVSIVTNNGGRRPFPNASIFTSLGYLFCNVIPVSDSDYNSYPAGPPVDGTSGQLPNLTPYQPTGWSGKIVVSNVTGTHTDSSPLFSTDPLYVDFAVLNNGNAPTSARFYMKLYVDGVERSTWYFDPPLNPNFYTPLDDFYIGSLGAGTHTIRLAVDTTNAIAESNESDNEYTKTITVNSVQPSPTLTVRSVSPTNVQVNQPFTVSTTLLVSNGTADHAGISISFPSLTSSGNSGTPPSESYNSTQGTVSTASSSSITGGSTLQYYGAGETLTCAPSSTCPAQHLLVEGDWVTVGAGNTRLLNLTVTPKVAGTFKVRIRGWATAPGYQNASRDPSSGTTDQQGFPVYEVTVTVQQTCNAPGAFSLSSPSSGQSFSSTTASVPLSWGASANADSYDVYFGTSSNPPFLANQTGTSRVVSVTAGQSYWWKIVARVNCNSSLTSTTTIQSFSVQQTCNAPGAFSLGSPSDGQILSATSSVTLSWGGSANANSYDVYFGTSSNPLFVANQTGTSRVVSVTPGLTYWWRVVAKVNCGSATSTTAIRSFSIQQVCNAPGAFSLSSPSNGQSLSQTSSVTLSWGASANANSYDVYFGTSSNPGFWTNVTGTSFNVSVAAGQTYWWKVVAKVSCNSSLTYTTAIWSFSVQTQNYTIAVNASPVAGGSVSGGGTFAAGSSRTVTATANSGYTFANWRENGSVVSSSASYTFTLNANRTLIANFTVGGTSHLNVALASNGGVATASSTTPLSDGIGSFFPSAANDGDHKGLNYPNNSFWRDGTASVYPDWLQIDFAGNKTINEIDVYSVQDAYNNPAEPDQNMTFSLNGLTAFDVQYWNGSGWVTVPGGSVTGNNKVWRKFTFADITTSKIRVLVNNALNTRSRIVELEAYNGPPTRNVALASNGGVASASSTTPNSQVSGYNFLPSVAIDGDRKSGVNFWRDDTGNAYPDWLQVEFSSSKNIAEIDVFTLQDNDQNPADPTQAMTFSLNGITAFDVQYWTGAAWVTVPNGSVTGNNKVWRQFTFSPIMTSKVRVLVNNALNTRSRIVELEAYTPLNVALASNGGVASASSTTPNSQVSGYNFLPSVAIDGDRKSGVNFWRDNTANAYPDWLQVDFNGSKNITEIDVFTLQDNDQNPADPTQAMTFSLNGITAFDVQYWTGAAWVTVPNGSVTGNNKVWRQFTFSPIATSKVRVLVNNALNTRSRIVELEAY